MIALARKWKTQPQVPIGINRGHWAAPFCEVLLNGAEFTGSVSTGIIRNAADERFLTMTGAGSVTRGIAQPGYRFQSEERDSAVTTALPKIQAANAFTLLVYMNSRIPSGSRGVIGVNLGVGTGAGEIKIQWFSDNNWYFDIGDEVERVVQADTNSGNFVYAFTWDGTNKGLYRDGVSFGSGTDNEALSGNPTYRLMGGCSVYMFAAFHKAFSPHAVAELSREPYGLFSPMQRRIYVDAPAVAGGVTYPQLERGIRGVNRGVAMGSYH